MSLRDLRTTLSIQQTLPPAARLTGTFDGTSVDLQGSDSACVVVQFGTWTNGTHTPSLQQSTDGLTWTTPATTDVDGTFTALASAAGNNTTQTVGYLGSARYLRVRLTVTGAANGALSQASVVLGNLHRR